jgi:hypothetical protein
MWLISVVETGQLHWIYSFTQQSTHPPMKRLLILLLGLSCLHSLSIAQTQPETVSFTSAPRHAVLAQSSWLFPGLENIFFHMVGYEYEYWRSKRGKMQMGVRSGVGFTQDLPGFWVVGLWLPVVNRFSFGAKAHRFELGLGIAYTTEVYLPLLPIVEVGYRYQPPKRGTIWRVYLGVTGLGGSVGRAF